MTPARLEQTRFDRNREQPSVARWRLRVREKRAGADHLGAPHRRLEVGGPVGPTSDWLTTGILARRFPDARKKFVRLRYRVQ